MTRVRWVTMVMLCIVCVLCFFVFLTFLYLCNDLMTRGEKSEGGDAGFCLGLSGPDLLLLRMEIRFSVGFQREKKEMYFFLRLTFSRYKISFLSQIRSSSEQKMHGPAKLAKSSFVQKAKT